MKLISITLTNFQGVRNLHLEIDGQNVSLFGDNATGKSTVANAHSWLLTDAPASNIANFTPKTTGANGIGIHHLEHSVEEVFKTQSGVLLKLKKAYRELWQRKRGSYVDSMTGHTTDYFVDDVPYILNKSNSPQTRSRQGIRI